MMLLAMAGAAFGADYTVDNVWTVNFGSEYDNGYEISGDLTIGTVWDVVAVEGGTKTSNAKRVHLQNGTFGDWSDDFQFSITLTLGDTISASNNWPVFFELRGDNGALRVGPYVGEGNVVDMDGSVAKNEEKAATVTPGSTHTITLTKIGSSLTAAVDGVVSSTGTLNAGVSGAVNNIMLGGDVNGYYKINSTVESISWGTVTVPEPATATLSLLALAGLAARRRR